MKWSLLGVVGFVYLAVAWLYAQSSRELERQYDAQSRTLPVTDDPDVIAEGERLARVYGCYQGCHGRAMQGAVLDEGVLLGRLVAPNLTRAIDRYSLSEFEAIVRQGILPDGTSVFGMPSANFATMTDDDFIAISSFIRRYPQQVDEQPPAKFGLLARLGIVTGSLPIQAARVLSEPWGTASKQDPDRLGDYLVRQACTDCHGLTSPGRNGAPALVGAMNQYDRWEFTRFMQSGLAFGDRDIGPKTELVRMRFAVLGEEEAEAIYDFIAGY